MDVFRPGYSFSTLRKLFPSKGLFLQYDTILPQDLFFYDRAGIVTQKRLLYYSPISSTNLFTSLAFPQVNYFGLKGMHLFWERQEFAAMSFIL